MDADWTKRLHVLCNHRYQKAAHLDAAKILVAEALFHRDMGSQYEHEVFRAQKRLMERLPHLFEASLEHAKADADLKHHREKKPLDCT